MAKAKKLPSGSWRVLVFDHYEPVLNPDGTPVMQNGKPKQKRIYQSFTDDDPSIKGRKRVELAAAQYMAEKDSREAERRNQEANMTLRGAAEKYIDLCRTLKRSPSTIEDYECIMRNGFQDLFNMRLCDISEDLLQNAIAKEAQRPVNGKPGKTLTAKRLKNEWGFVSSVLHKYTNIRTDNLQLPTPTQRMVDLPDAKTVMDIVRGTEMELPVLLAMWLSFTASEIRGLTKSKSINGDYITIKETVITVKGKAVRKETAKNNTRKRKHKIPAYIKGLIDKVPGDVLVPMTDVSLHHRWKRLQKSYGIKDPITFHDLRHLNASVMALLQIPDKYAQERGGWKSDAVMKKIYMQTFSSERQKVDDKIDSYFESIVGTEKSEKESIKEVVDRLKKEDPEGWEKAILEAMQHEMQHAQ